MINKNMQIEEAATETRAVSALLGYLARAAGEPGNGFDLIATDALLTIIADRIGDTSAALEKLAGGGIPKNNRGAPTGSAALDALGGSTSRPRRCLMVA